MYTYNTIFYSTCMVYATSAIYKIMLAGYIEVITKLYFFLLRIEVSAITASRKCVNSPESFCYMCGIFTIPSQRTNISMFVNNVYLSYFEIALGDQYKSWAPHRVCMPGVENLKTVDQEIEKEDYIWYSK